ncbi:MAG: alpha-galactosidase [SAR324 cluster bacterium]|nr:alpha-galactosidase [SAR324 cluster bacterium]
MIYYDISVRYGIYETAHIMGLYGFLDYLRDQDSDLLIDNCASGGRRLDFEMMKRSVCYWRSDAAWDEETAQSQTMSLAMWVPFTGRGVGNLSTVAATAAGYNVRSGYGGIFLESRNWTDGDTWASMKGASDEYGAIRDLFDDNDFYVLTGWSTASNLNAWMAWQYNAKDASEGVVQIFRRPSESGDANEAHTFTLQGLDPVATYTLTNRDDANNPTTHTGHSLINTGFSVTSPKGAAALFVYSKN